MTVAATRVSGAVLAVFVLLTATFFILGIGDLRRTATGITKVGGYVGIADRTRRVVRVLRRRHDLRVQAADRPGRRALSRPRPSGHPGMRA